MSWTIDPARQCICKRCDIAFGLVDGLVVEKTEKREVVGRRGVFELPEISFPFLCVV
jgi:hypothetical protein